MTALKPPLFAYLSRRSSAARTETGNTHVHRVLADDGGQRAAAGADDIADGDGSAADQPVDRRLDVRVGEVDLGLAELGLGGEDLSGGGALGGLGIFDVAALPGRRVQQGLGAGELDVVVLQRRLGLGDGGGLGGDLRLERAALELVEQVWPALTSEPSVNSRFSMKAVTRATRSTRSVA